MKTKLIFSILLLSFFIVGCTSGDKQTQKVSAFLGGTQGILVEFQPLSVEEQGIYTIFDTDTFPIEVTLRNKGEYQLRPQEATIKLMGPAKEEFSGISSWELKNTHSIDTISTLLSTGGDDTVSFGKDVKYKPLVKGAIDRLLVASVDYKYQTYLIIPEVCLKYDLTDNRICDVEGKKNFFVSGAPITITSVEESGAGKGIMALKIRIKNVGGAGTKVTKVGEEFSVQQDKLSYTIDDTAWECKQGGAENEARLLNGEAEIYCKLKNALPSGTIATKQLKLTFDYKYRDSVQETLRIKESMK